jgi:hypothetical protein
LAVEAGAPGTAQLVRQLRDRARRRFPKRTSLARLPTSLFPLADALEERLSEKWLVETTARICSEGALRATPALIALAGTQSRIIVTTNYDLAIENAAEKAGVDFESHTLGTLNQALAVRRDGALQIVHLHGRVDDPESIILGAQSYERAAKDTRVQYGLRLLASTRRLVFLGQSIGDREKHIRRDILWAADSFPESGPHLIVMESASASSATRKELIAAGALKPVEYKAIRGVHEVPAIAIQALGVSSSLEAASSVPRLQYGSDPYFVPVPMAPIKEVGTREAQEQWSYSSRLFDEDQATTPGELAQRQRVLLVGDPGMGKTQLSLRLGEEAVEFPLVRRLGDIQVPAREEDPVQALIAMMQGASTVRDDVPPLTESTLGSRPYLFLLDGLDEVHPKERHLVVEWLADVADACPQHRFVMTSRPLPLLDGGIANFDGFKLVGRDDWPGIYLERRGFLRSQENRFWNGVTGFTALMKIPLFCVAAAEMVLRGEVLPDRPLDLLMNLVSKGAERDEVQIPVPNKALETWLNRLALALELLGTGRIPAKELPELELHNDLGFDLDDMLLQRLVARVLLNENDGLVSFPSAHVQEARAAHALLESTKAEDILRKFVFGSIKGHVGIRSTWSRTIELVASSAPPGVVKAIAEHDPVVSVRAVLPSDSQTTRVRAIRTMWRWYEERRIWLPRNRDGEPDDLAFIRSLARDGVSQGLVNLMVAATRSRQPTSRGNAVAMLAAFKARKQVEAELPRLLADSHSVVRRHAIAAARETKARGSLRILRRGALTDMNGLAQDAFAQAYVALAPKESVATFMGSLDLSQGSMVLYETSRWTLDEQLDLAEAMDPVPQRLVEHIGSGRVTWKAKQVARFAALVSRAVPNVGPDASDVRGVLEQHPEAALKVLLPTVKARWELSEAHFLLSRVEVPALRSLSKALMSPVRELLDEYVGFMERPPAPQPPSRPRKKQRTLSQLVDAKHWDEVFAQRPSDSGGLSTEEQGEVRTEVVAWWDEYRRQPGGLLRGIVQSGDRGWRGPEEVWRLLSWAGEVRVRTTMREWKGLMELGLGYPDAWLPSVFRATWWPKVAEWIPDLSSASVGYLARALPANWPPDVAQNLSERVFAELEDDRFPRQVCAQRLAEAGLVDELRALSGVLEDRLLLEALVKAGDCAAERTILRGLLTRADFDLRFEIANDRDGFASFQCSKSGPLLAKVVTQVLGSHTSERDVGPICRAFNRCSPVLALKTYADLMDDQTDPMGGFAWYRHVELRNAMLDERLQEKASATSVASVVRTTIGANASPAAIHDSGD